ncbi:MAG: 3-phosphoshikimate 1-carboxyvinyltransferase [Bacteroidaceae bacterium]|nr:3-phosphoshikimate 1-carboxyvinyltransferase [Bacteroidaceae bacterium]
MTKRLTINAPERLRASVVLPSSKSLCNRVLMIGALAGGEQPANLSDCDDTRVMVRALGNGGHETDVMGAGTAMRFLTAYFSITPGERTITGSERMRQRPIGVLVDALRSLGADIAYADKEGFPPLRICGRRLEGGELSLSGSVSSQYVSALMMIGPMLERGLTLRLTGEIVSRSYIDLTMSVMRDFGATVSWTDESTIEVASGGYTPTPYSVENDWTAASYWYEMVALSKDPDAEVRLPGLRDDSAQGDRAVAKMFERLGVETAFDGTTAIIRKRAIAAKGTVEMDFTDNPDLAQTLVVTCCTLNLPFRFTGLQSLRIKETDRIAALETELRKWGYELKDEKDSIMQWDGTRTDTSGSAAIDTYDDHRMAMSFAPACLHRDSVTINNPEVVTKSYPTFWDSLRTAGFKINHA